MSDALFNLIITGQIPGTNHYVSFNEFIIGLLTLTIVFIVWKIKDNEEQIYDIYKSSIPYTDTADIS